MATTFMLYTSKYQGSCSNIKFGDYREGVKYTKNDVKLKPCTHCSHPFLAPFFMANGLVEERPMNLANKLVSGVARIGEMVGHTWALQ